ncbi:UDP-glycosyltransferase UGT5 [Pseudolycoriella hygida]|uniref:UDP-glycosyltransferase UGT5 n=1 Tax=Pseudolycoriella hygida TaxID=35572 RepID=A0A9Q0MX56_9DIPT|nr:UDP-glycosyltransferase UGT5 [Pseudolycoriella hygida]
MIKTKLLVLGLALLMFYTVPTTNSARIFGFFTTPSRSHFIIQESLMRELATRGHDVTVLTTFDQIGKPLKNYRYIKVKPNEEDEMESLKDQMMNNAEENKDNFFAVLPKLVNSMTSAASHLLNSPQLAELKKEQFDLIVFGWFINDFQIGLASHFNVPSVIISVVPNVKLMRDYVGNPAEVSAVPALNMNSKGPMTFLQRAKNLFIHCIEFVLVNIFEYFIMNPLYVQHFPPDKYPSYDEAKRNVSLVLINSHFSQGTPSALVPGLIEFSGMHIKRQPDPLPENIKQWLDTATDGAILFSMGSNIRSSQLSVEKRDALLRTFAKIKQKILWKFEEDLPNKPANVMISKWLPQDDVLAHPNMKLFISHCGKGGLSEAKYHGVPVLGIPIFGDQQSNIQIAVAEGWALQLQYSEVTEETFSRTLNEMLQNATYRQVIKKLSFMFRDRPQHPVDNAAFWVEYVIRHRGAKHMQSPAVHLNFFQYYSLDVLAVLFVVIYLSYKFTKCAIKMLFRKCCGSGKSIKRKED